MTNQKFVNKKGEAFDERLMETLNLGSLALMTTIGYRTGLFDAMVALDLRRANRSPTPRA